MDKRQNVPLGGHWSEAAYEQYSPLLLNALGRLTRQGFGVPLNEGMDLVHDFFLTQWSGVVSRYDPERLPFVPFKAYLFRAFVLFARRRIIFLNQWRNSLADTAVLARSVASHSTYSLVDATVEEEQTAKRHKQIATVRKALSQLPGDSRRILLDYLEGRKKSERQLADDYALSRYRVRESLVDAFGAILVAVGEQGQFTDREWATANSLWGRGRSLTAAALELATSSDEVREIRARILSRMSTALQRLWTTPSEERQTAMLSKDPVPTVLELLSRALAEPSDTRRIDALRERSHEVADFLRLHDVNFTDDQIQTMEQNPELLTAIYEALGAATELSEGDREACERLLRIKEEDDIAVGNDFSNLVTSLHSRKEFKELHDWTRWFSNVPQADKETIAILMQQSDVQASRRQCEPFIQVGIRPLAVFYATEAIASAAKNLVGSKEVHPGDRLDVPVIPQGRSQSLVRFLPYGRIIEEISSMTEMDTSVAEPLWHWLAAVCKTSHPFLFGGFKNAQVPKEQVDIIQLEVLPHRLSLHEQWSVLPDEKPANREAEPALHAAGSV